MLLGKEIIRGTLCSLREFSFPLRIACEGMEEIAWKIFYEYFRNDIDTLSNRLSNNKFF